MSKSSGPRRDSTARSRRRFLFEPLEDRRVLAVTFIDPNPAPGNQFGHSVVPLSTGNVVITSPFDDAGGVNAGAVYLFNGTTGSLISTLRGSNHFDLVGSTGVTPLSNGNFVVSSTSWQRVVDNVTSIVGAVTWGSGTTGVNGVVSASNSLIGSTAGDSVGSTGSVYALPNGNYVVATPSWDNGGNTDLGAVTFGSGATGVVGTISAANSLVGSVSNDRIGINGVKVLPSGNYVVISSTWLGGTGAVTWASGTTALTGAVSSANSLVGASSSNEIGGRGILELTNGNFVVMSPSFDNLGIQNTGAATWVSGTVGLTGIVSAANSLVGSTAEDQVGQNSGTALTNGNYVVSAPNFDASGLTDAGAAIWGSGTAGVKGTITVANALIGARTGDRVSISGIVALSNGNYVVNSPAVDSASFTDVGAVTWGNGTTGSAGQVTVSNSWMGSVTNDSVGSGGVTPLTNGNYVVASPLWNSGSADVGAVTWGNGTTGSAGLVGSGNSIVGTQASDAVGFGGVVALTNGNYVFGSPIWKNGTTNVGAVTWRNGSASSSGVVSAANSLIGSTEFDLVGDIGSMKPLTNGNYVVVSPNWDNGAAQNVGAITWGSGAAGVSGAVSTANSLVGGTAQDRIGSNGLTQLPNGNYVVVSTAFDNGAVVDAGAVTWANGTTPIVGTMSIANSLVGSSTSDQLGLNGVLALNNSTYVVSSMLWDSGALADAGSVTWASGTAGIVGTVNAPSVNHAKGLTANTSLQQISVDNTNGNFYARFVNEVGGVVRVGSQTQGFDVPAVSTLTGAFSGANFTVTDIDATGKNNVLTVSRVNVSGVDYYQFSDPIEAFASAPVTTPASTLSNGNKTLRVPVSAITGSLVINLQGGNDTLQLDLASGDVIPAGGLQYLGGTPAAAPGDRLIVSGGNQGDVTYNYTSASSGSVVLTNYGTITYSGLEQSISNTGTVADMFVNLPFAGSNTATLGDDSASGNGTSRLSGATFITTDFANPTGTVTLLRGNAADTFTFNALPDFTSSVALGTFPEPFSQVTFAGAMTLGSNKNLTAFSSTTIALSSATSDIATTGTGTISLSSARNILLTSGSSITTAAGNITLDANQQTAATTGDFIGIALDNADLISTSGAITVRGRGGNGSTGSQYGVRVMNGSEIGLGTSGAVTVQGAGGASSGESSFGVVVTGAGAAITSGSGNVIVTGTGGGTGSSGGNTGVVVEATGAITAGSNGAVTVNGTGSTATGANSGVVVTGAGSRITSSGGNVLVTGTATGATAQSAGVQVALAGTITAGLTGAVTVNGTNNNTAANSRGVHVTNNGSSITSNGGAVAVTGLGGGSGAATQNFGVLVDAAGQISAAGAGTVAVTGTGRNVTGSGSQNMGVIVTGSNARITSGGGNVSVTGTGGGGTSSTANYGVNLANNAQITATGTGTLPITANGGTGTGGTNHGLFATGSGSLISAGAGGISIIAAAGSGTSSIATNFTLSAGLTTSSTGSVNLAADSFAIDTSAFINLGTNNITLRPKTTGNGVNVGGADVSGTLGLTDAELDRITAGQVQIGDLGAGAIAVTTAITSPNSLAFVTALGINVQNAITLAVNKSFSGTAGGPVTFPATTSDLTATGTGSVNISSAQNIQLSAGSSITTVNGNLSLSANQQTVPAALSFKGIEITSASLFSSGTGNVTLTGRGGFASVSSDNHGVSISGSGTLITTGGGNVQITGTGGGTGNSNSNYGVYVFLGAEVRAGGAGTVTVDGFGGSDLVSSTRNVGVRVEGANTRITSGGGNVTINGRGGLNSTGLNNIGVWARQGSVITSGGTGSVSVNGLGGGNVAGGSSGTYGVLVDLGAQITSNGGPVNVTGTGGFGDGSEGVSLTSGGIITAGGVGNVSVQGTGGSGGGSNYYGIGVGSAASTITSSGGNVALTGVGGNADATGLNFGVVVHSTGVVQAGGAGSVTVNGTGGSDPLSAGTSRGVAVFDAGSRISAGNGGVGIVASAVAGTAAPMLLNNNGAISMTGTGSISVASDGLLIASGGTINAGTNAVTLKPKTAGTAIDLGGSDFVGALVVSDAEFDTITAGTIHFGDNTSGPLNITAALNRSTATAITLNSGSAVNFNTGTIDSAGGNVTLNPGATVSPDTSGVDVTSGAGIVGFGSGDDLRLVIAGGTVDTQYQQLNVAGRVDLTGADLLLIGSLVLTGGERFTVVENDGTDDIIGNFNGLPEGATVSTNFLGSGLGATISYTGGTGNDAVITVANPPGTTNVSIIGGNLVIVDIVGGTSADRITIGRQGDNIRITDPNLLIEAGPGVTIVSPNTVDVPFAAITGNIQVDTLAGDDWLTIDFITGNPLPVGGLVYSAGAGTADRLIVQNGEATSIVHTVTSATAGSLALSGGIVGQITYTDVEPITDTVTAANRIYLLNAGSESISLTDADGAANTLTSTLGWNVTFSNPLENFTLDAGTGDDIITVNSIDAEGPFNAGVSISGGSGDDAVQLNADITFAPNRSLDVDLQNDGAIPGFDSISIGPDVNLRTSGTGTATLKASRNISLAAGSSVQTVNGNIVVEANWQATPANGSFAGVRLDSGTIQATGTGTVTVKGRGGNDSADQQVGVLLSNGGAIVGGAVGLTLVQGTGGAGTGDQNHGVQIIGVSSQINSAGANVQVTGAGGGSGPDSIANRGIDISTETPGLASISAGGQGTVAVAGTGSNTRVSPGVRLGGAGAIITSSGGAVQVTGQGGNGALGFEVGVWLDDGATISSGPEASVTVLGTGGNSPSGINYGILLQSATEAVSSITSGGGSISIIGDAGDGAAGNNVGVFVGAGSEIVVPDDSALDATFEIIGSGGQGATGGENLGIFLGGNLSSPGPSISIEATSGDGPDSHGMFIGDSAITLTGTGVLRIEANSTATNVLDLDIGLDSTVTSITHSGTGAIEVVADSIRIDPTVTVSAANARVSIVTFSANRNINLGSTVDNAPNTLELSDAELDRIAASQLQIGDSASGAMTISAAITRAAATNLNLQSTGAVSFAGGSLNSGGGNIAINAGTTITPATAGVDITTGATGTLSFGIGDQIVFNVTGTTVDTQYQQLNVAGRVNLTGAILVITGTAPVITDSFVLVNNDGTDAIVGTFDDYPEGAVVNINGVDRRITYTGGTGNDVVILAGNVPPTIDAISDVTIFEDSTIQTVNLTGITAGAEVQALAVTATSGSPTIIPNPTVNYTSPNSTATLSFTPLANQYGPVTITVTVRDAGHDGILNNADDEITSRQFTVTVNPVNDPPTFNLLGNQGVIYNGGPQTVAGFITASSPGPSNEVGQGLTYEVIGNSNAPLFATQPTISPAGTLQYTPATDTSGSSLITVIARDSGGTANGGQDTSSTRTFVITVGPSTTLQVTNFTPTSTGFVVEFNRPLNVDVLNLYDVDPDVVLRRAGAVQPLKGSVVMDSNRMRFTYVVTAGRLPADDYTLTLRSAENGFVDEDATLLDGDLNNIPGDNYVKNFTVDPINPGVVAISIPNFARGPQQTVNWPANTTTGIPVSFSNGQGLLSASFQIRYNPALLNITGATIAPGMPAGTSVALFSFTPGIAEVLFTSQDPLPAGTTRFIDLQANVPSTALYTSKHVLDIANIVLSDNAPAVDDDAVAVVAYFGDTTANGSYSGQDASIVSRLAVGLINSIPDFRLLDPVVIADITLNNGFSGQDTTLVLRRAAALNVPEIPPLPVPALSLIFGGPDPKLSIPRDLTAVPGESLQIPLHIDSIVDLTGTGVESGDFAIYYDPRVIDVTGVTVGELLGGSSSSWMIASRIDPLLGRIFVSLASPVGLEGVFVGELFKIQATVRADAPAGASALNLAASAPNMGVATQLNEGFLTLIPAPTDAADDPIDGLLTIIAPQNNASEATARVVNGHLLVNGTTGDDVLLVGRLSPTQVVVRSGGRKLGTFAMPTSINIDAMSGHDYIYVEPSLPQTVIGTALSDATLGIRPDVIVAPANTSHVISPLPAEPLSGPGSGGEYIPDNGANDLALLQLLDQWSAGNDDDYELTPVGRRRR